MVVRAAYLSRVRPGWLLRYLMLDRVAYLLECRLGWFLGWVSTGCQDGFYGVLSIKAKARMLAKVAYLSGKV